MKFVALFGNRIYFWKRLFDKRVMVAVLFLQALLMVHLREIPLLIGVRVRIKCVIWDGKVIWTIWDSRRKK